MWFGKVAIILYLFSFAIVFSAYYLNNTTFHDASISQTQTYVALQALENSTYAFTNHQVDSALIFGDFVHVFQFIAALFTNGMFASAFGNSGVMNQSGWGGYDLSVGLFITIMFDAATTFLILYIISNRSL